MFNPVPHCLRTLLLTCLAWFMPLHALDAATGQWHPAAAAELSSAAETAWLAGDTVIDLRVEGAWVVEGVAVAELQRATASAARLSQPALPPADVVLQDGAQPDRGVRAHVLHRCRSARGEGGIWVHHSCALTKPEARSVAQSMRFTVDRQIDMPQARARDEEVYRRSNMWTSRDKTSHSGGDRKWFDREGHRTGTWNADLTVRIGD